MNLANCLRKSVRTVQQQSSTTLPKIFANWEYTSSVSLKYLHPGSSLKLRTISESEVVSKEIGCAFSGYIPLDKIEFTNCYASGPGGQHVNKTRTKVELRFHLQSADWIHEDTRKKLTEIKKNQINKDGFLVIKSDKTRSYILNKADVLQRLRTIIYNAAVEHASKEPNPESEELWRKRKESANRERLRVKSLKSLTKQNRVVTDF